MQFRLNASNSLDFTTSSELYPKESLWRTFQAAAAAAVAAAHCQFWGEGTLMERFTFTRRGPADGNVAPVRLWGANEFSKYCAFVRNWRPFSSATLRHCHVPVTCETFLSSCCKQSRTSPRFVFYFIYFLDAVCQSVLLLFIHLNLYSELQN